MLSDFFCFKGFLGKPSEPRKTSKPSKSSVPSEPRKQ